MGVLFHVLSTGGGSGASRVTRYIAERDRDPVREGSSSRRLFSDDQGDLSYHRADRILDPDNGHPEKDDLIHFSVMIEEEEFDNLGTVEKEKQARFREAVREAMKGVAVDLNAEELTWVAGIHRNSENPHAHIVMSKDAVERGTGRPKRIARIPKSLLPHRETENGQERLVNGPIGERLLAALEKQQALYLKSKEKQPELTPAEKWERLAQKHQKGKEERTPSARTSIDGRQISSSWNPDAPIAEDRFHDFRIALGKRLALEFRLAFAEVWHERAVQHGDTYRFQVVDQSLGDERKISELDVRRRAAARATRISQGDQNLRNDAVDEDLARHRETLQELAEARVTKIAALGKDVGSLRGNLAKVEESIAKLYQIPAEKQLTPLLSRQTLSELQQQAVKLNLPDRVAELEKLRVELAKEHSAPTRTGAEAETLGGQFNVAHADLMAREARLGNFEASVHLTPYEVQGERWSLAALDKQISHRTEDSKLVPQLAQRLDLRALGRINYSNVGRQQAAAEIEHLTFVRGEIVRQIEQRRLPLVEDRNLSREMVDVLEHAYALELRTRVREGTEMPEPRYEAYQIRTVEASAETLRDPELLREVHEWEKAATKNEPEIGWEGRAIAREITSGLAVTETRERLQHFLESKQVASLNLGHHQTGTLREVEARTLTEYVARVIESSEHRDYRHTVKTAAREHHGRLVADFEKASDYQEAAREMASEAQGRDPQFTDKEKMNLEIYAERQNDASERERYLELARSGNTQSQEREVAASRSR